MEILYKRDLESPDISLVLLDWTCRESAHIFRYLANQTVPRDSYEIIWIEYYSRRFDQIQEQIVNAEMNGAPPPLDNWIVLGIPENVYYHKHLMYNIGIAIARGRLVCIMDSDAIVSPTFIESIVRSFSSAENIVLHLDEVRNVEVKHYPFRDPTVEEILGEGCKNWTGTTTTGLLDNKTPLYTRNYGACMCGKREDLISIGGADEHIDFLGHVCGPYDMTFRLVNAGKREVWHEKEFLYHVWHPGTDGINNYIGPHDGRNNSSRALEAIKSGRVLPLSENPVIREIRMGKRSGGTADIQTVQDCFEPGKVALWKIDTLKFTLSSARQAYYSSRFEEAVRLFKEIEGEIPDDSQLFSEIAWACSVTGDADRALEYSERSLILNSENSLAHKTRGWVLFKKREFSESVDSFTKAIEKMSVDNLDFIQESFRGRGWVHFHLDECDLAFEDFTSAMNAVGKSSKHVISQLFHGMALVSQRQGKTDQAIDYYTKVLESIVNTESVEFLKKILSERDELIRILWRDQTHHPVGGRSLVDRVRLFFKSFTPS
jgi:tetratricopeptide (TPR) repeat protein